MMKEEVEMKAVEKKEKEAKKTARRKTSTAPQRPTSACCHSTQLNKQRKTVKTPLFRANRSLIRSVPCN
jgi:hypothetical protein